MGGMRQAGRQALQSTTRDGCACCACACACESVPLAGARTRSQIELSALRAEARAPPSLPKALNAARGWGFAKSRDIGFFDTL